LKLEFDFFLQGFDVVFGNVFTFDLLGGNFHIDLVGEVFDIKGVLIKAKVFSSGCHEGLFVSNNFAIEGVNDGIGLFEEAVDSANLLKILFPFGGVFDDDTEIDVFIFGLDSASNFLALNHNLKVHRQCQCCQQSRQ
jgi:hypothetical protein